MFVEAGKGRSNAVHLVRKSVLNVICVSHSQSYYWSKWFAVSSFTPICIACSHTKHRWRCWVCDSAKICFTLCTFFATSPIKLNSRQQMGGGLLIANHLDQSLWWANQKHSSHIYYRKCAQHNVVSAFTNSPEVRSYLLLHSFYQQIVKLCWAKNHFPKPNRHIFWHFFSNFTVQDHILSTAGDALKDIKLRKTLCARGTERIDWHTMSSYVPVQFAHEGSNNRTLSLWMHPDLISNSIKAKKKSISFHGVYRKKNQT
jgi:hypothetical protein